MEISVSHLAALARLSLNEKEEKQLETDVAAVLAYVDQLRDVDTSESAELTHAAPEHNVLRADETSEKKREDEVIFSALLHDRAPEYEEGFIRVPLVIDKNRK